jgi:WD40 repeat protein
MPWPVSQDYNEAIQDPKSAFGDLELQQGQLKLNSFGVPLPCSGNFADVYEVTCPASQSKWAVKCFTRQVQGLRERYTAISKHLQQVNLPFGVDFQFLERGIRIRGDWFPVLKMRWVEGLLLNQFLRDNLDKPVWLQALSQIWQRMAKRLREADIAHGDLQHGNVLLVPSSKQTALAVKLIDYDGMWVPALARVKSGEVGHPNYQHPQRCKEGTYDAEVDRFPLLVVATALQAVRVGGKSLWERYDNGDNLLFREADLVAPERSALFGELAAASDPLLRHFIGRLKRACSERLQDAPLLEEVVPEDRPPPLPRRAGEVTAAAGASSAPRAITTAPTVDLDFEPEPAERPLRRGTRGKQRRAEAQSLPAWAWWAGGGVLAAIVAMGTLALLLLLRDRGNAGAGQVAFAATTPATVPIVPPISRPLPATQPEGPPATKPPPPPEGVGGGALFRMVGRSDDLVAVAREKDSVWQLFSSLQGRVLQRFGADAPAKVVAFDATPDGTVAITAHEDRSFTVWNTLSGRAEASGKTVGLCPTHVALSADSRRFAAADGSDVVVTSSTKSPLLSSVQTCRLGGKIGTVAVSPDGAVVACGETGDAGQSGRIWLREDIIGRSTQVPGHTRPVTALAFSPDGHRLASAGGDLMVRFWRVSSGAAEKAVGPIRGEVRSLVYSADGTKVIVGSTEEWAVVVADGNQVLARGEKEPGVENAWVFDNNGARVFSVVVPQDQRVRRSEVRLQAPSTPPAPTPFVSWPRIQVIGNSTDLVAGGGPDPETWQLFARRKGLHPAAHMHSGGGPITCLSATLDGKFVITGTKEGKAQIWEVALDGALDPTKVKFELGGALITELKHEVTAVALAPDGKRALTASGGEVILWGVARQPVMLQRFALGGEVTSVAFSPDGKRIGGAAIRADQPPPNAVLWCHSLEGPQKGQTSVTPSRPAPVCCVAFSPDSNFLAGIGADGSLAIRDVRALGASMLAVPCRDKPRELRYSPDGKKLLVSTGTAAIVYQIATKTVEATYESGGRPVSGTFVEGEAVPVLAYLSAGGKVTWSTETKVPVVVAPPPPPRPPPPPPKAPRRSIPTKAEQSAAVKELRARLKDADKGGKDKVKIALQRLIVFPGQQSVAERYVALKEYAALCAEGGAYFSIVAAADQLARSQGMSSLEVKTDILDAVTPSRGSEYMLAKSMLGLVAEARAEDRYDLADRLAKAVRPIASTPAGAPLVTLIMRSGKEATDDLTMAKRLQEALAKLETAPEDAEANLSVGVIRCRQERWGEGLSRLAGGSDKALAELAQKDLTEPADAAGRIALGAAWDKQAALEKARGLAEACLRRSAFWYRQALLVAAPNEVKSIPAQLRGLEKRLPELVNPWREMDLSRLASVDFKKDHFQVARNEELTWWVWHKGGVDVTMVVRAKKADMYLSAGQGGMANFRWEGNAGTLRLHRPNAPIPDGTVHFPGAPVGEDRELTLGEGEWHTLRWQLTSTGQKVWVDDKLVGEVTEANHLSIPRPVHLRVKDSPIDVKSVVVRDLGMGEAPAK